MNKFVLFVFAGFLSASAMASSTVCSGERLYQSNVRRDSGVQPPVGSMMGTHVIVFDRQVLLSYEDIVGLHPHGVPPYRVLLEDEQVLEETNGNAQHFKVIKAVAILQKVDSLSHQVLEELGREPVVCRETQNFVP